MIEQTVLILLYAKLLGKTNNISLEMLKLKFSLYQAEKDFWEKIYLKLSNFQNKALSSLI